MGDGSWIRVTLNDGRVAEGERGGTFDDLFGVEPLPSGKPRITWFQVRRVERRVRGRWVVTEGRPYVA